MYSGHQSGSTGMKRFPFLVCLAFLLVVAGTASAADSTETPATNATVNTTTTIPAAPATTTPDRIGGSIYFETDPAGATIWLDNLEMGASPFTYYSEKTGTFTVRAQKKGYEEYTGTITVSEGRRVVFSAVLTPVTYDLSDDNNLVTTVATTTTTYKSTMVIPTPWPTSPASPADPAVILLAVTLGAGFMVIRRR
jgi:hypothetical protein